MKRLLFSLVAGISLLAAVGSCGGSGVDTANADGGKVAPHLHATAIREATPVVTVDVPCTGRCAAPVDPPVIPGQVCFRDGSCVPAGSTATPPTVTPRTTTPVPPTTPPLVCFRDGSCVPAGSTAVPSPVIPR